MFNKRELQSLLVAEVFRALYVKKCALAQDWNDSQIKQSEGAFLVALKCKGITSAAQDFVGKGTGAASNPNVANTAWRPP